MWRITKEWKEWDTEVVTSRVGHQEEDSRISAQAVFMGMKSEPLPSDLWPLVKFRLRDEDGNVFYWGELHDDDDCLNQDAALSFGAADVGATHIEIYRGGKWVQEIG